MKKTPRRLKGMTLVEVLVALAIFSIISALLASSVAGVCDIIRKTDRLNKKIVNEAPNAELRQGTVVTDIVPGETTPTDIVPGETTPPTTPPPARFPIKVEIGGSSYSVDVHKYYTYDSSSYYEEGGDFRYFSVAPPTEKPTEAPASP